VVGLIAGAAVGWFTAPRPAVDIHVGGVNIKVDGSGGGTMKASDQDGTMAVEIDKPGGFLNDPATRAIVFAVIGGAIGFGAGTIAGGRKTGV
jgi:hypothetical protein